MKRLFLLVSLSLSFCSLLYTQTWHWQNPLAQGNRLSDVFFLNTAIGWTVSYGGMILHTTNGGATWELQSSGTLNDLQGVYFIDNQKGWIVGDGGTILHTTNGGVAWLPQSSGTTAWFKDVFFIDSQKGWVVGGDIFGGSTILRTSDGGATWLHLQQSPGTGATLYGTHFIDNERGWAVGEDINGGSIFNTTDGGLTWESQSSGTSSRLYDIHFTNYQRGWVVGEYGTILHTIDGGATWQQQSSGTSAYLLDVQFIDDLKGWAIGYGGMILNTTDSGVTWQQQTSGTVNDLQGIHFIDGQRGWSVGDYGRILYTEDGGATWQQQSSGVIHNLHDIHFTDGQRGWAVGRFGTILYTTNGGTTWQQQSSGIMHNFQGVHFTDNQRGWVVGYGGTILHTMNGGVTWGLQSSGSGLWLEDVQFIDNQRGWIVGESGTILHTTDGGTTWSVQPSGTGATLNGVHFTDSERGWAVGGDINGGTILSTTDGGLTWEKQSSGAAVGISVYFIDNQRGWIVGDGGVSGTAILHTIDGGATWQQQSSGIVAYLSGVHFINSQEGWAVGYDAIGSVILHTSDGGQNWISQSSGIPFGLQSVYFTDSQNGWAVGGNGTILKYSDFSLPIVAIPQLTLSTVQLNPGQILTFNGKDFTPNNAAVIFIAKPDGTEQEINVPTNASGTFTHYYAAPGVVGSYSVRVKDLATEKFTVNKAFLVTEAQSPVDYLTISSPAVTDVFYTDNVNVHYFPVKFSDKMFLSGGVYPIQGAYRLHKYDIEYSLNNGPWQYEGQRSGMGVVNEAIAINFKIQTPVVAGSYRVRITDAYNPVRKKISPVFVIQSQSSGLKADFLWDYSYQPQPTATLDGVAADGVSRFYIKVHKQGAVIESASVVLEYTFGGEIGRVMKATVTDQYSTEANQASDISATNTPGADNSVWFWYVSPENFVSEPADELKRKRTVIAQITANFMDGSQEAIFKEIDIVRPPVMLAHGLGGKPGTWDNFRLSNGTFFKNDPRFILSPWAITLDGFASFVDNASTLVQHQSINSIPFLISDMHKMGYACNQVDYICHSMGGSVMRFCLSNKINGMTNTAFDAFFGKKTYGKGYSHKIITLNTPHNGSPIADLLYRYQNYLPIKTVAWWEDFYKNGEVVPAIINLQIDPTVQEKNDGGINFPSTPLTSRIHRIASKIDCDNNSISTFKNQTLWTLLYDAYRLEFFFDANLLTVAPSCNERRDMFTKLGYDPSFFDASDLIVGTNSQLADDEQFVSVGNKTIFDNLSHSPPFDNRVVISTDVADRVFFLLNQGLNSAYFAPLPATPNFSGGNENANIASSKANVNINYSTAQKSNGNIEITSPLPGDTLTMDEAMQLGISVLDTTGFRKLSVLFQDALYSSVATASQINFNLQVNGNLVEKQKILAVGYYYTPGGGAEQYVDEIEVYITTDEPVAAFDASPQVNLLEKGENFRPTYTAVFSTNVGELGDSPALTAMIENPAVLAYQPDNNSFTALDTGSTYVVVTFKGVSDTLFFLIADVPDSIVIDPPGSVSAAFSFQTVPCANATVNFTSTSTGAASYLWEFGDGNFSTSPNPTHQYSEPGVYNVILSVTNSTTGESDLIVHTVDAVNTNVVQAEVYPTGTIIICDGDTLTLTANAGAGYTYQWLRNGSPVVNGNNQHYIAYQWGFFTVRVTDATGCSSVSAPTIITVTPAPSVTAILQGPAAICPGDSTTLKATSTGGVAYQWLLNGAELPGATSTELVATLAGNYAVVATNGFGCTKTSFPVTVSFLPAPAINASADDNEICTGDATVLRSTGGVSYIWNPGNGSGDTVSVLPSVSTLYTVTGTGANGCTATDEVFITVYPEPLVDIGNDTVLGMGQVLHLDAGPGFTSYYWSTGHTTQAIDVFIAQTSFISIQVVDAHGCVGFDVVLVEFVSGIKDADRHKAVAIRIFPNPTPGILNGTVSTTDAISGKIDIALRNSFGQIILTESEMLHGAEGKFNLDLSALPSGSYMLQLKSGNIMATAIVLKI